MVEKLCGGSCFRNNSKKDKWWGLMMKNFSATKNSVGSWMFGYLLSANLLSIFGRKNVRMYSHVILPNFSKMKKELSNFRPFFRPWSVAQHVTNSPTVAVPSPSHHQFRRIANEGIPRGCRLFALLTALQSFMVPLSLIVLVLRRC